MKKSHLLDEWKFKLDACSVIGIIIAGFHVEIFRHKRVLYLNVFSWGLLLNNGEKNTVVLNNRRHLRISHKQRNTAEFVRIPCFRVVPPRILHKESPQEIKKLCKEARPRRPSSEFLLTLQGNPQGVCKKRNFTVQGCPQASECPRVSPR